VPRLVLLTRRQRRHRRGHPAGRGNNLFDAHASAGLTSSGEPLLSQPHSQRGEAALPNGLAARKQRCADGGGKAFRRAEQSRPEFAVACLGANSRQAEQRADHKQRGPQSPRSVETLEVQRCGVIIISGAVVDPR
jgi:hypothetical protein